MKAAFIVTIQTDLDATQLPLIAEDLLEDLAASGYDVESVKPWRRPSLIAQQSLFNPPPQQPPPLV